MTFNFSRQQVNLFKGFAILFILLHNFFHLLDPMIDENEFLFDTNIIKNFGVFFYYGNWAERINLFFSIWGHYGVSIFVLLSGYGLFFSWKKLQDENTNFIKTLKNYLLFLYQRIAKLYPTLLLVLGIYFLFFFFRTEEFPVGKELTSYFVKLTFTSNIITHELFSLNGPWWFYSLIVQLYLILPILYFISTKTKGYGLLLLIFLILIANYFLGPLFNSSFKINYYALPFHYIPLFGGGLLMAQYSQKKVNRLVVIIGSLILFVISNFFFSVWLISGLAFSFLTISLLSLLNTKTSLSKILLFVGTISMYLFAIHGFLRIPFLEYIKKHSSTTEQFFIALLFSAISIFGGWCLSFIEPKIRPVFIEFLPKLKIAFKENETLLHNFTKQSFLFLILFITIRIFESLFFIQEFNQTFFFGGTLQDLLVFGKINSVAFILFCICVTYFSEKITLYITLLFWTVVTSFSMILSFSFTQDLSFQNVEFLSLKHVLVFILLGGISLWIQKQKITFIKNNILQKGMILISFILVMIGFFSIQPPQKNINSFIAQKNKFQYFFTSSDQENSVYENEKRRQYSSSFFLYTSDFEHSKQFEELEKNVSSNISYSGKNSFKSSVYNKTSTLLPSISLKNNSHSFNVIIEGKIFVQKGSKDITTFIFNLKDNKGISIDKKNFSLKKCLTNDTITQNKWITFKVKNTFQAQNNNVFNNTKVDISLENEKHSIFYIDDLTIVIDQVKTSKDLNTKIIYQDYTSFETPPFINDEKHISSSISYLGKNSMYVSKDVEYAGLSKNYTLTKEDIAQNKLLWKSILKLYMPNKEHDIGEIVIQIVRKDIKDNIYWHNENIIQSTLHKKIVNKNIWYPLDFQHQLDPKKLNLKEGDIVKFFLWTKGKKKEFYYDDVQIELHAF